MTAPETPKAAGKRRVVPPLLEGKSNTAQRPAAAAWSLTEARADRWAAALLSLLAVLLVHGAWEVGPTFDEHYYVASGYATWQTGDFSINREHPPLLKALAALPLLAFSDVEFPVAWDRLVDYPAAFFYRLNAAHMDRNLFLARLPACLLTVLLAWAVYRTAKRFFGPTAGLVALLLLAFNPNVLAHGRLAALDMGTAALLFPAVVAYLTLMESPSARAGLRAAVLVGLAHLAKFTAILALPLLALLALIQTARTRSLRPLGWLFVVCFGALGVFSAGYGFEARSRNEAWAHTPYVGEGGVETRADPTPAELGTRLSAAHPEDAPLGPARYQRVAGASDLESAIGKLVEYTGSASPELSAAAQEVVASLAGESRRARQLAFEKLLEGDEGTAAVRLELCRTVARRDLEDLESARVWWGRHRGENWDDRLFSQEWLERGLATVFGGSRPVPLFSALRGLDYQLEHGGGGHLSYYNGEVLGAEDFANGNPHPEYYSVVLAAKNPPLFLFLVAAGCVLAFVPGRGWSFARALTFLGFPAVALLVFSGGSLLLGVKYLLPIFPFLVVLAARTAVLWPRLALVFAVLTALEGLWMQPHQLMYYNVFAGGPRGGPELTVVGDDWGQGVRAASRYYAEHREAIDRTGGFYYEPYTMAEPESLGLRDAHTVYGPLEGIVAVHAVDYYRRPERYGWLADFEPYARLGWSLWLFDTRGGAPGGSGPISDEE